MASIHKYNLYTHLYIYIHKKNKNVQEAAVNCFLRQECKHNLYMNMEIDLER